MSTKQQEMLFIELLRLYVKSRCRRQSVATPTHPSFADCRRRLRIHALNLLHFIQVRYCPER